MNPKSKSSVRNNSSPAVNTHFHDNSRLANAAKIRLAALRAVCEIGDVIKPCNIRWHVDRIRIH